MLRAPEGAAPKGLVRDTGEVFEAVSERDQQLAGAITGSEATFGALADADEALAETIQILPTFQRESRATLQRLDEFQADTRPLVQELLPVANDISPTLDSVRRLSPNLESLFNKLDPLIDASENGFPALERFLGPDGLRPVLDTLDPFLANFNPAFRYLAAYRKTAADFLIGPSIALAGTIEHGSPDAAGAAPLPQAARLPHAEALSVYPRAHCREPRQRLLRRPSTSTLPGNGPRGIFPSSTARTSTTRRSRPHDEDVSRARTPDGSDGGSSTKAAARTRGPDPLRELRALLHHRRPAGHLRRRALAPALPRPVGRWPGRAWKTARVANATDEWAGVAQGLAEKRGVRYEEVGGLNPRGGPVALCPGGSNRLTGELAPSSGARPATPSSTRRVACSRRRSCPAPCLPRRTCRT